MTENAFEAHPPEAEGESGRHLSAFGVIMRVVIILLLLGAGAGIAVYLIKTKAKPERKKAGPRITLVEFMTVRRSTQPVAVEAMGTVKPAVSISLVAQVNGKVIDVAPNFMPGGAFNKEDVLLKIDPEDYRLAVKQRESDVARAQGELQLEKGRQIVARQDLSLVRQTGGQGNDALILREPQLLTAEAALAAAKAALGQAELNLKRTEVLAPFNGIVSSQDSDLGAAVGSSTRLGTLIGTDRFYVEVLVPVAELPWIQVSDGKKTQGSKVKIFYEAAWGSGGFREGKVLRMLPGLEPAGRLARILVGIDDPLARLETNAGKPGMVIGAYVRAVIEGRDMTDVFSVPASAIRDGDQVWVAAEDDTLIVRTIAVVRQTGARAFIRDGLAANERVIVSDLSTPVAGMALRYPEAAAVLSPKAVD